MKKLIWIFLLASAATAQAAVSTHDSTFGFIDLLQWQVRESGADNWAQTISPAGVQRTAKIIDAPFDWNTGIRIGLGRSFNQRSYDLSLAYTHYQTTASNQASGIVYSSYTGNYFANNTNGSSFGPNYRDASIRWQFFYNTVDLNLGKQFAIDPVLQLHPYIGLKAASINQKIYTNWNHPLTTSDFTAATENLRNDFRGAGPTVGADSSWIIYAGERQALNLIGNLAIGLLYGHWNFDDRYANNKPFTATVAVASINGASPMADGLLGLEWSRHFAASDMSIRLGYEAQVWFNQLQFYSLSMGRVNRPTSLQGGDLEFRYNI